MSEANETQDDQDVEIEAQDDRPNNLMEALRRKRQEAIKIKYLELDVQGYGGLLAVTYTNAVEWLAMRDLMRKAERDKAPQAVLWANIDLLVRCTVAIKVRLSTDEPYETVMDPVTGSPAPWGGSPMVKFFALESVVTDPTARNVMRKVFPSDIAISAAAGRIMSWIQDMDTDAGEETSGE